MTLHAPPFPGLGLQEDASIALYTMDVFYQMSTGLDLPVNHGRRSWFMQALVKARRPRLAAWPWESAHVRGLAVDISVGGSFESEMYLWLAEHAPSFGWQQPEWAEVGGSRPEPWHWEYMR